MLEDFQEDPSMLLGKQFNFKETDSEDEGDSDGVLYEVVEVRLTRGGKVFHVQFDNCGEDRIDMASEEMMSMLERSTFVDI
jgi:hypothetical protein